MPKGQAWMWSKEELEQIAGLEGREAHEEFAKERGLSSNTIYSTRSRVRVLGGIEAFLEKQHVSGEPFVHRPETLDEQLARTYLIRVSASGRDGATPQYTLTLPSSLAARFVEQFGRAVRFEPAEEGISIIPQPKTYGRDLPSWAQGADA